MEHAAQLSSLKGLSDDLSALVARLGMSIVRVEDGSRLTATGVVWSAEGIIVTTSHGVERDEDLSVELASGELRPATLVGRDPDTDIAVLRVQLDSLTPIPRSDADTATIGSLVLALARPGNMGLQATLGIVSARTETQSGGRSEYLLHSDADMYPGFSGGPLVDMDGNIVGLTNLMFGRGRGIALGTPIVAGVTHSLLTGGRVQRGYLGIRTQQVALPDSARERIARDQNRALLIAQVETGSPAESAGLLLGDTLMQFNDVNVTDVETLRRLLRSNPSGSQVPIEILRGGEPRRLTVVLGSE